MQWGFVPRLWCTAMGHDVKPKKPRTKESRGLAGKGWAVGPPGYYMPSSQGRVLVKKSRPGLKCLWRFKNTSIGQGVA